MRLHLLFVAAMLPLSLIACSDDGASTPTDDGGITTDAITTSDSPVVANDAGTNDAASTPDGKVPRAGACQPAIAPVPNVQTARPKGSTCAKLGYHEYVPAAYAGQSNWPLIIFFHGDGERGDGSATQLANVVNNGLPRNIKDGKWDPQKRFVVLSPQMDDRNGLTERGGQSVKDFIEFAKANYDVDVKRIYLTGLSGGGAPVYNYLSNFQGGEIAAAVPISGWYSTQGQECSWKQIPIWYFHGNVDGTVPAKDHSTKSYNTLVACGPAPAVAPRYTLFKDVGHAAWDPTYQLTGMNAQAFPLVPAPPGTTAYDISVYDWLLKYSR